MQAACHRKDGTIIADYKPDHGGSSEQTERRTSLGLLIFHSIRLLPECYIPTACRITISPYAGGAYARGLEGCKPSKQPSFSGAAEATPPQHRKRGIVGRL